MLTPEASAGDHTGVNMDSVLTGKDGIEQVEPSIDHLPTENGDAETERGNSNLVELVSDHRLQGNESTVGYGENGGDQVGPSGDDVVMEVQNLEADVSENDLLQPSNSHVLVEGQSLEALLKPIKASTRIKVTTS